MIDDGSRRAGAGSLVWPVAALLTTGLVVAVGCGDDAGGGATSQGGDDVTPSTSVATTGGPGATTGGGDGGAGTTTGTVVASVGPGPVSVSASSTGVGGGPPACDPPADPSSLHAREAIDYATFQPVSMCEYRDQVLLIVNVAAL